MKLADLPLENARFDPRFAGLELAGIAADSRKVKPGDLFVAVPGTKSDGLSFVPQALAAGAAAVMAEQPAEPCRTTSPSSRSPMRGARWRSPRRPSFRASPQPSPPSPAPAARLRSPPSRARSGRRWASQPPASAPSAWCRRADEQYGSLTTPDPIELHRTLDPLAGEGVTHLALEASSHGLDQHRLDGVRVTAGAFTNLSRDHLDYHPTLEAYLAAKLRLFTDLIVAGGTAVIGVDDCYAGQVVEAAEEARAEDHDGRRAGRRHQACSEARSTASRR